jgi:hypothetical protein
MSDIQQYKLRISQKEQFYAFNFRISVQLGDQKYVCGHGTVLEILVPRGEVALIISWGIQKVHVRLYASKDTTLETFFQRGSGLLRVESKDNNNVTVQESKLQKTLNIVALLCLVGMIIYYFVTSL